VVWQSISLMVNLGRLTCHADLILIRLLGPVDIRRESPIDAPKTAAMLGALALAANHSASLTHSGTRGEVLWPTAQLPRATKTLRKLCLRTVETGVL
jgi:DNA-binding SARP family transcriptional activator